MGTGHIYVRPTWFSLFGVLTILFGGFNPSDKYESQLGLLFSIYGKMFQTTNQIWSSQIIVVVSCNLTFHHLVAALRFNTARATTTTSDNRKITAANNTQTQNIK